MLNGKPQRGRPKGSGIDDTAILLGVTRLMEADPHLKPTTAIKAAGITDPSAIRRLREKLRQPDEAPVAPPSVEVSVKPQPALACASSSRNERLSQPAAGVGGQGEMRASDELHTEHTGSALRAGTEAKELLVAWMSLGVTAFNAALQAQQLAAEHLMRLSPVHALIRQHVTLSEMAIAFYSPRSRGGATLH